MIGENIPSEDQQAFNHLLIHLLEELNLPYAIGGSIAAMRYSETRYTRDIDIMFQTDRAGLAYWQSLTKPPWPCPSRQSCHAEWSAPAASSKTLSRNSLR